MRAALAFAIALPLVVADLALKLARPTPDWAWHERSFTWLVLCAVVLSALALLLRVPSQLLPPAVGILAGGVLGNAISAAWNGFQVPNPIVVTGGRAVVAFNLADVWVLIGLVAVSFSLALWLVRNRELLPEPRWRRHNP